MVSLRGGGAMRERLLARERLAAPASQYSPRLSALWHGLILHRSVLSAQTTNKRPKGAYRAGKA